MFDLVLNTDTYIRFSTQQVRDQSFSAFAKFSEELTFLTP